MRAVFAASRVSSPQLMSMAQQRDLVMSTASQADLERLVVRQVKGDYAVLTLNRPKVNALDYDMLSALRMHYRELGEDPRVRGVILTGARGVFSGGLDVPYLTALTKEEMRAWFEHFYDTFAEMTATRLLTIAAISGHSPAGGAVMALTTDHRVMAKGKFTIGLNEVAVGLAIPAGVVKLAISVVGQRNAEKMMLTGKLWSVDEALKLGLIDDVVDLDELLPHCERLMKGWLASTFPNAVYKTKEISRKNAVNALKTQKEEAGEWLDLFYSEETQSALRAFRESIAKKAKL